MARDHAQTTNPPARSPSSDSPQIPIDPVRSKYCWGDPLPPRGSKGYDLWARGVWFVRQIPSGRVWAAWNTPKGITAGPMNRKDRRRVERAQRKMK